jgi:hypothetical protein
VREWVDADDGALNIHLRVTDKELRRMAYGDESAVDKMAGAVDRAMAREVGNRARAKWYLARAVPRLGAGTHASRGRR